MTIVRSDTNAVTPRSEADPGGRIRLRRIAVGMVGVILVAATLLLVSAVVQRNMGSDADAYDVVELNRARTVSLISRADPPDPYAIAELNRFRAIRSTTDPARDGWSLAEQNRTDALADLAGTPVHHSSYGLAEQNRMAAAASID